MSEVDVKESLTEFGQAFEEFKKVNDERLERIEKGEGTALLDEKMAKIESKLDAFEDISQKLNQAEKNADNIKEQVSKLETVIKRPNSGLDTKAIDERVAAFDAYYIIIVVAFKGRNSGFHGAASYFAETFPYLRNGLPLSGRCAQP